MRRWRVFDFFVSLRKLVIITCISKIQDQRNTGLCDVGNNSIIEMNPF